MQREKHKVVTCDGHAVEGQRQEMAALRQMMHMTKSGFGIEHPRQEMV